MTSKLEQMAYKMQPAGHEEQQPKRKYTAPDKRLAEAFDKWKSEPTKPLNYYKRALNYTKGIEASVEEAHALLYARQDDPKIYDSGIFISAIYNKSGAKEIIFDMDLETNVNFLAYNLRKDKTFINCSDSVGLHCGKISKGTLINYGRLSLVGFGSNSTGKILNYGYASMMGSHSNFAINLGECGSINYGGFVLNFGETDHIDASRVLDDRLPISPERRARMNYLKNELEKGRTDYRIALAVLKNPAFQKALQELECLK